MGSCRGSMGKEAAASCVQAAAATRAGSKQRHAACAHTWRSTHANHQKIAISAYTSGSRKSDSNGYHCMWLYPMPRLQCMPAASCQQQAAACGSVHTCRRSSTTMTCSQKASNQGTAARVFKRANRMPASLPSQRRSSDPQQARRAVAATCALRRTWQCKLVPARAACAVSRIRSRLGILRQGHGA